MLEKLSGELANVIEPDTLFCGGHFILEGAVPKALNAGTIQSFEAAVAAYALAKRNKIKNVGLGILLNDIGQTCESSCSIAAAKPFSREEFSLPEEYKSLLEKNGISESEISIYWEKHMRNRGKKLFHKRKNNTAFVLKDGDYYLTDDDGYGDIVVLRQMGGDKYGTCACPMIMAAYADKQEQDGYKRSVNVYYIGNDNTVNIPNYIVIEKGKRLGEVLGTTIDVKNIYFSQEDILKNF